MSIDCSQLWSFVGSDSELILTNGYNNELLESEFQSRFLSFIHGLFDHEMIVRLNNNYSLETIYESVLLLNHKTPFKASLESNRSFS